MKIVTFEVKDKKTGTVKASGSYKAPESLDEAINMFGGQRVLAGFLYQLEVNERRKSTLTPAIGSLTKEQKAKLRDNPEKLAKLEELLGSL